MYEPPVNAHGSVSPSCFHTRPLSDREKETLSRSFDDRKKHPHRTRADPHADGIGKGSTMLHFVPGQRVGMFVPYAGLAQQQGNTVGRR